MRSPEVLSWLETLPTERREPVEWLAERVEKACDGVTAAMKWRRLTFTLDDDWHHWLCAVAVSKRGVDLVFHKGSLLDDPDGLLAGDGRYVRQVSHDRAVAAPAAVDALIHQAVERRTDTLDGQPTS